MYIEVSIMTTSIIRKIPTKQIKQLQKKSPTRNGISHTIYPNASKSIQTQAPYFVAKF